MFPVSEIQSSVKHLKKTDSKDTVLTENVINCRVLRHCPPIPILKRWDIICKWSTIYEHKKYFTWTLSMSSMSQDAQTGKWWKWNTYSGGFINLTNCKSAELVNHCQYEDNIEVSTWKTWIVVLSSRCPVINF